MAEAQDNGYLEEEERLAQRYALFVVRHRWPIMIALLVVTVILGYFIKDLDIRNDPDTLSLEEAQVWDKDRRALLGTASDPDYFTLEQFRAAMGEAREMTKEDPAAQRILDQLDAWAIESGIKDL